jgi:hypothetical protein
VAYQQPYLQRAPTATKSAWRRHPFVVAVLIVAIACCGLGDYGLVRSVLDGDANPDNVATVATPKASETPATIRTNAGTPPKSNSNRSPTSNTTHFGVKAGAFCDEHGDYGLTAKRKLMRCTTSDSDDRYRWRAP